MIRGDLIKRKFSIRDKEGNILKIPLDDIFITFKKNYNTNEMLFQKRLSNGTIEQDEEGIYHFQINPEDTDQLFYYDNYVFDIEIYKQNESRHKSVVI